MILDTEAILALENARERQRWDRISIECSDMLRIQSEPKEALQSRV